MSSAEPMQQYRAATEGAAIFDLSDCSKIEVSGPDARGFLHNLCTQDVSNLPVGGGCEAFLTTTKARVVAHLWIGHYQSDAGKLLWLDAVAGQGEKILQHLNHYLISERVELADRTRDLALLRLVGPQSAKLLANLAGPALAELKPLQHLRLPGLGYVRRQQLLALEGFDLFSPAPEAATLRQHLLEGGAVLADPSTYQILRIEAGLPEFGIDIDENRLAMETGRTAQAISYTKGCYLGQETIVMARDRGQVNRMLMGVKVAAAAALAPGTKLFRGSEEAGHVTSSALSPRLGQVIALAYLRRGSWEAGTELLTEPTMEGRKAVVCALPFSAGADSTLM